MTVCNISGRVITPTSMVGLKLILLAHDAVTVWLLVRCLQRVGRPPLQAIIYAWCPLPMVEVASSGHLEPLGMLGLLAAGWALGAGRAVAGGMAWAAAVMTKSKSTPAQPSTEAAPGRG